MSGATIASIVMIFGALVLAVRGLRGGRIDARKGAIMAASWVVIIIAVVWAIGLAQRS